MKKRNRKLFVGRVLIFLACLAQLSLASSNPKSHSNSASSESNGKKYFIGSSAGILINLFPSPPVYYGQLDFGCHISKKDVLITELVFWHYDAPMGNTELNGPKFPGSVFSFGFSLAYQRFIWKGAYFTSHLTPMITQYRNSRGNVITYGFQPWIQLRPGYHFSFELFENYFFLEPSLEFNYWPLNINIPKSFLELEEDYPNYLFAPGLNFGFKF